MQIINSEFHGKVFTMRKNKAIAALLLIMALVTGGLANVPSRVAFCHGNGEAAFINKEESITASAALCT